MPLTVSGEVQHRVAWVGKYTVHLSPFRMEVTCIRLHNSHARLKLAVADALS